MQTSNNTVLITGGAAGIGLALTEKFLSAGNTVIITSRDATKLDAAHAQHPSLITVQADINDPQALERLAQGNPTVNILINNAGVQYNYEFADPDVPITQIETELQTNLISPLYLTKLMLPQLLAKPIAAIVNISSGLGFVPKQSAPVYCGSKAGLHIATKALRWQLATSTVKVFEIIPPLVDTAMTAGRGRGKISPAALVDEFWGSFSRDRYEIAIGRTKHLLLLQRLAPALAERVMRPGL